MALEGIRAFLEKRKPHFSGNWLAVAHVLLRPSSCFVIAVAVIVGRVYFNLRQGEAG